MSRVWLLAVGFTVGTGLVTAQAPTEATAARELAVTIGKAVLVDSPAVIERIAVSNGSLAEAVAVSPREIMINGKAVGETSLIVWQQGGNRLFFDLTVLRNENRLDAVKRQLAQEMGSDNVTMELEEDTVFLRGTVSDLNAAERAVTIASTIGKPVNLLRVKVPEADPQILLKVRFADVDRSTQKQLGISFATGQPTTVGSVSTGQAGVSVDTTGTVGLTQALNVFLFRRDINLGAAIQALQAKNLLQILAEPNVLAINGHNASFLAGGEFPYPTLQGGGGGLGAVTIQFREFGVRINFTPTITPRGTIKLDVTPEVSTLDFANGLIFQGFTIPGLSTRRVQTQIELEDGQSFAIGGLLDNRDTESYSKIPGLGDIPFIGKLMRSKTVNKSNTELLILVTPEVVRPVPSDKPAPDLNRPGTFLDPNTSSTPPRTPGMDVTGPVPPKTPPGTMTVEQLTRLQAQQSSSQQPSGPVQYIPVPMMAAPAAPQPTPQTTLPAPPK